MTDRAGDDRGQTTHDFAFGVSLFLLATVFVVSFVPSVTSPYGTGITETEQEQSQAVGRMLMANLTEAGSPTRLNATRTNAFFTTTWGETGLQERFGLPNTTQVNVTIRRPEEGGAVVGSFHAGEVYRSQSAATTVRIVQLAGNTYRLEVRVW